MKKLRLKVDALEVSSFVPEKTAGHVEGMEMAATPACPQTSPAVCYPSAKCTGTQCVVTAEYTCMTESNYAC